MIPVKLNSSIAERMINDEVLKYQKILEQKKASIAFKRAFDITVSAIMLAILIPLYLLIAAVIKLDSKGRVIYKQERITKYGRRFYIYKFRTMVENADKSGSLVTVDNDRRITRVGRILRKLRLDETLQLINIIKGDMSFVGTRPEVLKYAEHYTDEMLATLLLPAGVTSPASIFYKDEDTLLAQTSDADDTYVNEILPQKMKYNLEYLRKFSLWYDVRIMFMTVFAVLKKENIKKLNLSEKDLRRVNQ